MVTKLVRQRGVLYPIVLIPLSLFFILLDPRSWGILLGVALLVATARRPWLNLLGLACAALIAYIAGYRIEFITNPDGGVLYVQRWSWLITLAWIVVVSQGVSTLGQLDPSGKLLSKTLMISGSALLLIALLQGQWLGAILLGLLLTVAFSFRRHDMAQWSRAIGYGLSVAAIVGVVKTTVSMALLAPLIALVVPCTSTLSIAYRLTPSWVEDLKRSGALVMLYALSAYGGVLAFLAVRLGPTSFVWGLGAAIVSAGFLLWAWMRLHQTTSTAQEFMLFGTPIDCVTLDEAVQRVESLLSARTGALVCTPDTTALMRAQRDRQLREIYAKADLVTPDGIGIVWAGRLLGAPVQERVSGIDLLEKLFSRGRALRIFLLGAAPGVAEQAAMRLRERYPHVQIVGTHHGYFRPDENKQILTLINQAQPDIVLVGLGVPKQELWMYENRAKLTVSVLIGVGGCFDVWAGRLARAPQSWRRLGLEWLYRALQEPKRLARVSVIPLFLGQVFLVKLIRALLE